MEKEQNTSPTIAMVNFVNEKHILVAFSDGRVAMLHSKDLYPFAMEEPSRGFEDHEKQDWAASELE